MKTFEISLSDDDYSDLLRCLKRLRLTYDCVCITRDVFCSTAIRRLVDFENDKMDNSNFHEYDGGVLFNE